jgi:hypothetical protein
LRSEKRGERTNMFEEVEDEDEEEEGEEKEVDEAEGDEEDF